MSLLWDFFNRHIVVFFETSVLKEVRILRYLHNNSAVLILMLSYKIKLSHTILIHTWKTFVADFFYDNVFHTLYFFNCSTLLFIKLFFLFSKKSKHQLNLDVLIQRNHRKTKKTFSNHVITFSVAGFGFTSSIICCV